MPLSQRRSRLVARLRVRKTREREGLVLVEGVRAVAAALEAGADPSFAVTSPRLLALAGGPALARALGDRGCEIVAVDDGAMGALADTEQPQGVLLVCTQPVASRGAVARGARLLVLDGIQDPGNVGTLLRGAAAFGVDGVVALDGTADPWGTKAVRSSAGLVFHVPLLQTSASEAVASLKARDIPILVADAAGGPPEAPPGASGWALVVGNEGAGPRGALRAAADVLVGIPMRGPAESLNAGVAGSILLYALTREMSGVR